MTPGIHKHGRGYRATVSVSTPTYATEAEAEEAWQPCALGWHSFKDGPAHKRARAQGLTPLRPSIDYPRPAPYMP